MLDLGRKQVGKMTKKEKFIAGVTLYAAEETKGEKGIGFSNSDPQLIKFMMEWFRNFCKIPDEKFRGSIWLHQGLDEFSARKYWSTLTKIPINQFHKTYIADRKLRSIKVRKNLHSYWIFQLGLVI